MPNLSAPPAGSRYTGLWRDMVNNTIELYANGTLLQSFSASVPNATTGAITATTTITAGTNLIATAGDARVTAGNLRLGAISTFATTEPTSAVVMKVGTNPVGAITTSGGLFVTTGGATISKIIAAGTVSQVET